MKFFSRRKKEKVPVFVTLKHKDELIRLWIDKDMKPYKVEIRTKSYQGYLNVDEFLKRMIIL
ncbi:MAG: hypothetical protein O6761_00335 [Thaumarchaeota archaeon]|nr:hypothetical protein [Nitrososphaerota archaeon]